MKPAEDKALTPEEIIKKALALGLVQLPGTPTPGGSFNGGSPEFWDRFRQPVGDNPMNFADQWQPDQHPSGAELKQASSDYDQWLKQTGQFPKLMAGGPKPSAARIAEDLPSKRPPIASRAMRDERYPSALPPPLFAPPKPGEFDVRNILPTLGTAGGSVLDYVRQIGADIPNALGELKDSAGDILSNPQPTRKELFTGKYDTPEREAALAGYRDRAGRFVGSIGAAAALPFTEVVGGINEAQAQLDPVLKPEYEQRLQALTPEQRKDKNARQAAAHEAIDYVVAKLLRAVDDPNLSDDEKRAAFAGATLYTIQRVAEFGGPQIVSQLGRLGISGAKAVGKAGTEALRPPMSAAAGLDVPQPPVGRYVADVGKTRSLVKDTATGETMPVIFGGPDHAAKATAEAARRNLPLVQEAAVKVHAAELVPQDSVLRKLTTPQLIALRESGSNLGANEKAVIDAILGERAFTSGPAAQITAATRLISPDVATAVRRSLRTAAGTDLTPKELLGAPGFGKIVDDALAAVKADRNIPNRTALAQAIIDEQRKRNVFATVAAAKKSTGDPVIDRVQNRLSQITEDVKGGLPPDIAFDESVDAILSATARPRQFGPSTVMQERIAATEAAAAAEPTQLSLDAATGGGGGPKLPPTKLVPPKPIPPGKRVGLTLSAAMRSIPDVAQATRGLIAGGDFSQAGRQTFPVLFSHPLSYAKGNLRGAMDIFRNERSFLAEQTRYKRLVEQEGISVGPDGLYLAEKGAGIVAGEDRYAGWNWIKDKVPSLAKALGPYGKYLGQAEQGFVGGLNATRTYSFLGSVKALEWAYRRRLTLAEKQAIASDINIITGRGFKLPQDGSANDMLLATTKLANGLGFSLQNSVARARLITDTPKAIARIAWDTSHGRAPRPGDVEFVRLAGGYVASVTSMWAIANAAGIKIGFDPAGVNFGKIDLGTQSKDLGIAVGVGDFLGFSSQSYGGHVYIDPGQGVGQDIRLLYRILFQRAVDSKGHVWNPWQPKFGEQSVMDLLIGFTENRLNPAAGTVVQGLEGRSGDLGDITENPVTGLLIPLFIQSGLQASGETQPGGSLYLQGLSSITAGDAERKRLNIESPDIPELNLLSSDRQTKYLSEQKRAKDAALSKLISSPEYRAATDADKRDLYEKASAQAAEVGRKVFGLDVALNGTPGESVIGLSIAVAATPRNYDRAELLNVVRTSGKLTAEAKAAIDAKRKQVDLKQPDYDMSVDDYLHGYDLRAAYDSAPHFIFGTATEWEAAERAASQYKALIRGMSADQIKVNAEIQKFYYEAAGGKLATYFSTDGSRRTKYVSPQRQLIEKDALWQRFRPDGFEPASSSSVPRQVAIAMEPEDVPGFQRGDEVTSLLRPSQAKESAPFEEFFGAVAKAAQEYRKLLASLSPAERSDPRVVAYYKEAAGGRLAQEYAPDGSKRLVPASTAA